jgi:DNA-binding transcriptional ArsR family regulator
VDEVFRALADPSRRRLLDCLNDRNGQTLRELCAGQGLTRQAVSKHLAILEAANLVITVRRGLAPGPTGAGCGQVVRAGAGVLAVAWWR